MPTFWLHINIHHFTYIRDSISANFNHYVKHLKNLITKRHYKRYTREITHPGNGRGYWICKPFDDITSNVKETFAYIRIFL